MPTRPGLMGLPTEIRVKVYEALFEGALVAVNCTTQCDRTHTSNAVHRYTSIMQACKTTQQESSPIFFEHTKFIFCYTDDWYTQSPAQANVLSQMRNVLSGLPLLQHFGFSSFPWRLRVLGEDYGKLSYEYPVISRHPNLEKMTVDLEWKLPINVSQTTDSRSVNSQSFWETIRKSITPVGMTWFAASSVVPTKYSTGLWEELKEVIRSPHSFVLDLRLVGIELNGSVLFKLTINSNMRANVYVLPRCGMGWAVLNTIFTRLGL